MAAAARADRAVAAPIHRVLGYVRHRADARSDRRPGPGGQADTETGAGTEEGASPVSRTGQDPVANGKIPDDIPPADNDSILEAQIRRAAMNEPDPEIRERLWDEYRKYKGLPTKGRSS